jgi:hypothetical protein
MLPGRAGDGSDLRAQRLRCRQRGRSVGPSLDGTLRQPARHERDRVAAHDRHAADATSPDQRCDANYSTLDVGCSFDVGCSSDVGPSPDDTEDLTRNDTEDLTRNVGCGADAIVDLHAAGFWHAGLRRGLGALGWTLLIVLVVGLVAAWLIWRSRRKSAWDGEAGALEMETRTATSTQLPSVLTAETPGQRALSWPPLRSGLIDLMRRWDLLADRAFDDQRRNRSVRIRNLLQELVAAVDAENEALATGRDWRLLRPRVDQVGQALSAVLAGMPQQEPAPGGESGRPAPGNDTT